MPDPKISVPIKNIDSSLKGPSLDSEISHCFEEAYSSFISKKSKQEETDEIIKQMGELLTISKGNLEKVQNQKWFKRAWHTITGKNKKLERINHSNLLKVQKGALFFLQNLAELNEQMMETVAFSLQRIEDIQIESAKLKGYLIQIVQKYNKKIGNIENKLGQHDKAIKILQYGGNQHSYLLFGIIILVISIASLFVAPTNFKWIISIALLLLSITLFVLFFRRISQYKSLITTQSPEEPHIENENNKLIPQIAELIYSIYVDFANENLITSPYSHFYEKNEKLSELYLELNTNGIDKPTIASVVNNIISIKPETTKTIDNNVKQCSNEFCEFHSKLVKSIQQDYIPNLVGMDVLSSLDLHFRSELTNEIMNGISPYNSQFEQVIKTRKTLQNQFSRFKQIMNESGWKTFGKGLLEGITFDIVSPLTDDENFVNEYINNLSYYGQLWNSIAPVIHNSVIQLNAKSYDEAIKFSINSMQPLFDEFNNQNISIFPLLKQLNNGLE